MDAPLAPREAMDCDVVVVGAGPAGLATAIRLRQLAQRDGRELSVIVLEKGVEPGAHILSGAVMDPVGLDELIPDWAQRGAPLHQPVTGDDVLWLGEHRAWRIPDALVPPTLHNVGHHIVSLSDVVRWLAREAEALGVEIFAGFAATEVLYDADGAVCGVATGDVGLQRDGRPGPRHQRGMALHARYTVFAEGARGQLGRELIARHGLDADRDPQSHAIGIKELWEVPAERARPGRVVHTTGWPLSDRTYGGGFLYHLAGGRVSLGLVVGLDYDNPWLSPFEEMQRWKTHPAIRAHLEGGRRIGYGARAIAAGGLSSLPRLVFPGGMLVGCEAGLLNAARIKGSHAALHSGRLAAEAVYDAVAAGRRADVLEAYPRAFEAGWLHAELHRARNFKAWFKKGRVVGSIMTGVEQLLLPRLGMDTPPWTLRRRGSDHAALRPAIEARPIDYPRPDGRLTFDRASSVFLASTAHDDAQPVHLRLRAQEVPVAVNLARHAGPEARYCPAGVYEFLRDDAGQARLQINAQNCVHCKTCDIKDPTQNIVWTAPEGGSGPCYAGM